MTWSIFREQYLNSCEVVVSSPGNEDERVDSRRGVARCGLLSEPRREGLPPQDCPLWCRRCCRYRGVPSFVGSDPASLSPRGVGERLVHLAEILEASTDFVATTDLAGDLLYANAAFRNRFAIRTVDGMVAERYSLFDFFTEESRARFLRDAVPQLWKGKPWSGELAAINPDGGDAVPIWQSAFTHFGPTGQPLYFSGIARDMSAIKEAQEGIRASEERFRALVAQGSDVILIVSLAARISYASPAIERILGYSVESLINTVAFDLIHPDDLDEVLTRFIATTAGNHDRGGSRCRVRHRDGSWRWAELFASDHTATIGIEGIIVNARDITARHSADEVQAQAAALLSSVMRAAASEAIFVTDEHARIVAFSRGAECLLGYTAAEVTGMHPSVFHLDDEIAALATTLDLTPEELFVHQPPLGRSLVREWSFVRRDGTTFDGSLTVSARHDVNGNLAGFLYMAVDITERRQREAALTKAAEHDALTGLANRSQLQRALEVAVADNSWHTPGRILLFIDLDHFKNVNDTLGHAAGDAILVEVAHRLTDVLRSEDLAVRIGGDEFVVLLSPTITIAEGTRIAERIVASIGRDYLVANQTVNIGASVGLACSQRDETPEQLLIAADAAAYDAKRRGRGRVSSFTEQSPARLP